MTLRWVERRDQSWFAYSGELIVGMIGLRGDGIWFYDAGAAVNMRWTTKGYGEVRSRSSARRAVERAWAKWLTRAGLQPAATSRPQ